MRAAFNYENTSDSVLVHAEVDVTDGVLVRNLNYVADAGDSNIH